MVVQFVWISLFFRDFKGLTALTQRSTLSQRKMASMVRKTKMARGREDEVYVAAVPLRATKGPAQLLMSAAYSLNLWDLQHFMVLLKPHSPSPQFQALVYDFQPKDPESVFVALEALSGRPVSGVVRARKLSKLPKNKCWFVGPSKVNAADIAFEFNKSWETDLVVGRHDCRDYTNRLVEFLTGEKHVLERLRRSHGTQG